MKRPAFQFYPKDWRINLKLRRCSDAAKGAWIEILCFLHDSEEYGVARFPLREIASSVGVKFASVTELVEKGVFKGGDKDVPAFKYTPKHAGKVGPTVTLLEASKGPMWYSSRFVKDEHRRNTAGIETRFKPTLPLGGSPPDPTPDPTPSRTPSHREGDGTAVAVASALPSINRGEVRLAGGDARPVDKSTPGDRSTSTPMAAAHSTEKAQAVIEAGRIAREQAVDPPEELMAKYRKREPIDP